MKIYIYISPPLPFSPLLLSHIPAKSMRGGIPCPVLVPAVNSAEGAGGGGDTHSSPSSCFITPSKCAGSCAAAWLTCSQSLRAATPSYPWGEANLQLICAGKRCRPPVAVCPSAQVLGFVPGCVFFHSSCSQVAVQGAMAWEQAGGCGEGRKGCKWQHSFPEHLNQSVVWIWGWLWAPYDGKWLVADLRGCKEMSVDWWELFFLWGFLFFFFFGGCVGGIGFWSCNFMCLEDSSIAMGRTLPWLSSYWWNKKQFFSYSIGLCEVDAGKIASTESKSWIKAATMEQTPPGLVITPDTINISVSYERNSRKGRSEAIPGWGS